MGWLCTGHFWNEGHRWYLSAWSGQGERCGWDIQTGRLGRDENGYGTRHYRCWVCCHQWTASLGPIWPLIAHQPRYVFLTRLKNWFRLYEMSEKNLMRPALFLGTQCFTYFFNFSLKIKIFKNLHFSKILVGYNFFQISLLLK